MPSHPGPELAARLEGLAAEELRRFVSTARTLEPFPDAALLEAGGGAAAFIRDGSPMNRAGGLGMAGPVDESDVALVERFYAERDARALIALCPLAHPTLAAALSRRGWTVDGFENVLVAEVDGTRADVPLSAGIEVAEALTAEERDTWRLVAAIGFSAPLPPLDAQLELGEIIVARPGTRLLTAFVDGRAAGTGELLVSGEVAWLSADATLPQFRRRGVQAALQHARLAIAREAGCTLAVSEAEPGGGSQRNMERAGFSVAYTRVDLVAPGNRG